MRKGGPATVGGKAVSSRNATRHGILAMVPVVPGLEQEGDWEAHRHGVFRSLAPEGHLEEVLADRVALQLWRLHRVARYEATSIASAQETAEGDVLTKGTHFESWQSSLHNRLDDAQALQDESRELLSHIQELRNLAADALLTGSEPAVVGGEGEGITREAPRVTGSARFLPNGENTVSPADWNTDDLRDYLSCVDAVEARLPQPHLEEILKIAPEELVRLDQALSAMLAQFHRDLTVMSARVQREQRERLLPAEKNLEKIARYEAHLSRELYKAMHELEALQERRQGRPAPLARLEINGLAPG